MIEISDLIFPEMMSPMSDLRRMRVFPVSQELYIIL